MSDIKAVIRSAVEGNVAVFYPCECDEHESGYEHFVDRLAAALTVSLGLDCDCNLPAGVSADFHTVWCKTRATGVAK